MRSTLNKLRAMEARLNHIENCLEPSITDNYKDSATANIKNLWASLKEYIEIRDRRDG